MWIARKSLPMVRLNHCELAGAPGPLMPVFCRKHWATFEGFFEIIAEGSIPGGGVEEMEMGDVCTMISHAALHESLLTSVLSVAATKLSVNRLQELYVCVVCTVALLMCCAMLVSVAFVGVAGPWTSVRCGTPF